MQSGTTGILKPFQKLWRYLVYTPRGRVLFVIITLAFSLAVRVFMFRFQGFYVDENNFTAWYNNAAQHGIRSFFDTTTFCDYPPLNVYFFWIFGKISQALGPDSLPLLLKLPQNLFDLATAFLIFRFMRAMYTHLFRRTKYSSRYLFALGAMAVYALNPATIFDLAVWGQMDSIYTFFMVASLYSAMRSKYELSSGLLSLGVLTKPQSVVLLPVVAYLILRNGGWKRALSSSAVFIALIFIVIAPFRWDNPITFLIDHYSGYAVYEVNSAYAYNFWALLGFWKPDNISHLGLTYQWWGVVAFLIFAAFVMWQLHRKPEGRAPILAAALLMFGFFMLMTRMHERYLFPVFALLAMSFSPKYGPWVYIGLMATFFFNLAYVLSILNNGSFIPDGHWSIYVVVSINAVLFLYAIWEFYRTQRAKPPDGIQETGPAAVPEAAKAEDKPPPKVPTPWSPLLILVVLVAIFLSVSLWNLGDRDFPHSDFVPRLDPEEVYFDLGAVTQVDKVYLLDQDASHIDVDFYWGSPGDWNFLTNLKKSGVWREWERISLGQETRYVSLVFKGGVGRFGEVAFFSEGRQLPVSRVTGDRGEEFGSALIDEQHLVGNPESFESGTYFDEIYFVRTAEEHLNLEEPSQWDHPPMSKLIIAYWIAILDSNPFSWRIAGVICATLMIPIIYLFARRMFKSSWAGLVAAFLLTFDFMHFAEARIAKPETFILFFVLLMFYFFYLYWENPSRGGKYLFLSLVCFGFGFATKWVVMYGFVGMMLLLVLLKWRQREIHKSEVLWFAGGVATAVAIYMLSYIPYFLAGHNLPDFWDRQWRMFEFHSGLGASHPYASEWYTWPLMLTPVYLAYGKLQDATSYIVTFGNPALWWASMPVMIATLWLAVRYRSKVAIFIVIPFLAQWLFFIPITRVLFIYHFYPNVLFMILAITFWAKWLWERYAWGKWAVGGYLALNVACFIFFFPVISGLFMPDSYWNNLRWLVHWVIYS